MKILPSSNDNYPYNSEAVRYLTDRRGGNKAMEGCDVAINQNACSYQKLKEGEKKMYFTLKPPQGVQPC